VRGLSRAKKSDLRIEENGRKVVEIMREGRISCSMYHIKDLKYMDGE